MTTGTKTIPIFDGHNDVLLRLRDGGSFFERNDIGHLDLPRAVAGGFGGGFCAVFVRWGAEQPLPGESEDPPDEPFVPDTPGLADAQSAAIATMARLFRLERESGGTVKIVRAATEIDECLRNGVFAALLHMEGAESIDPELDALEVFYRAGLRSIGPVWSRPNIFGHGVPFEFPRSPDTGPGLTDLGRELIRTCNQLGILVDVSHLTERGFWDVAELSDAPLVATHSNAHVLTPSTRNLTDRQLDAIRDSDGIVGVNFCVAFLRADGASRADTPLDAIVRHVDYLVERLGIDRVGFGSDFDGATIPVELGDAAGLLRLMDVLRRHGYGEPELHKLANENWLRVLRATWGE
ncbi:MAG TPA: dipeptidase [Chloroflexota bacterium]